MKTPHLDHMASLNEQIAIAKQKHSDLHQKAHEVVAQRTKLEEQLVNLLEEEAGQEEFDGRTRRGSKAAKVQKQRDELVASIENGMWQEREQAINRRIAALSTERRGYATTNIEAIAEEMRPDAEAAARKIEEACANAFEATNDWFSVWSAYSELLAQVPGLDGSDLPPSDAINAIRAEVERISMEGIGAPLPRSLFPTEERAVRRVRQGDGFVAVGNTETPKIEPAGRGWNSASRPAPAMSSGAAEGNFS